AGCTVIGGHSIRDEEIKFGYSVTGIVHPQKIMANSGARVGDKLILTKALGTGVISTAIKKGKAKQEWIDAAVASMTTLNKVAAEIASKYEIHGMTDITGFGLIGHGREMALASNVSLSVNASRVPLLPGALECVRAGFIPGGLKANREFAECGVGYDGDIPDEIRTMLFDPQTAGGLLISVAAKDASPLSRDLTTQGLPAAEIGEVAPERKPLIVVS
ncbi:MAG TPA: selenide, water dikinase SelD, partial [Terriglobales bacterium]|nr:selenide, water dikinase SelD [Terriglobales bacterium]